jgi:hypothetical protein
LPPHSSGTSPRSASCFLHAVGQCVGLVDLVHGHDDWNFRGVRVIDSLHGLRHHAVVGGHDQHHNVSGFRAARPHARKRFVTRRIEEHNLAPERRRFLVSDANFVSANVLRDATRLAFRHAGQANRIEQRGLAVIDVAHDRDHRRTRRNLDFHSSPPRRGRVNVFRSLLFERDHVGFRAEEARHFAGQFRVERLVHRRENTAPQQREITSFTRISSFSARSFTLMPSVIVMLRVIGIGSFDTTMRGGGV